MKETAASLAYFTRRSPGGSRWSFLPDSHLLHPSWFHYTKNLQPSCQSRRRVTLPMLYPFHNIHTQLPILILGNMVCNSKTPWKLSGKCHPAARRQETGSVDVRQLAPTSMNSYPVAFSENPPSFLLQNGTSCKNEHTCQGKHLHISPA